MLRARKKIHGTCTRKSRYFAADFQSIDLAVEFLNSEAVDDECMIEQADADMKMADEVDEADFDASNEVDNDGIDAVVEERPAPMLPMLSPSSSMSAMSNHDGDTMNFSSE